MNDRIYWSAAKSGFFHESVHGARRIWVIDDEALADAVEAARTLDDTAFEAALAEAIERGEPEETVPRTIEHLNALLADPPLLEIDNSDCQLPADAVEVSADSHAAMLAAQANGEVISSDDRGYPVVSARSFSAEEQIDRARIVRDKLLTASDWTQAGDAPLKAATKKLWADHRKALRDLPARLAELAASGADLADLDRLIPAAPA